MISINPPKPIRTVRTWWECQECHLIFQSPHPTMEENAEAYIRKERDPKYPTLHDRVTQYARAERQIEVLKLAGMEKATKALDFGSASGILLDEFRTEWGCEVIGIEYNPADFEHAAKRNVSLVRTMEELPDVRFDIFSLSHFLEHVDKPVEFLQLLREKYALDDAFLMVEVPTAVTRSGWIDEHMVIFNPLTLEQTIEKAGWEIVGGRILNSGTIIQVVGKNSGNHPGEGRESGNSEQEYSDAEWKAADSMDN